jgi:hypothetical protein
MVACGMGDEMTTATGMFDRTMQVSGPVDLDVQTGSGIIRIKTGPDRTVRVIGHIKAFDMLWSGVEPAEQVRRLEANPPVEQHGDAIRIGGLADPGLEGVAISYDLTVPVETRIRARSGSGDQVIGPVRGPVDARSGSGSVRIDHVSDLVRVKTGSGRIEALGSDAGFEARAGSGSIYAEAIAGPLRVRTGSGRVEVEQVEAGPIDVETGSGSVKVRTPANATFDLNARTGSGSIESRRPLAVSGAVSRHHLRGRLGEGGPPIQISTGSGNIRID